MEGRGRGGEKSGGEVRQRRRVKGRNHSSSSVWGHWSWLGLWAWASQTGLVPYASAVRLAPVLLGLHQCCLVG